MHALVRLATRKWLESSGKLQLFRQRFISSLSKAFPPAHYENWPLCQSLFAHVKSAAGEQPEGESSLLEWAALLYRAAWYALEMINIDDARKLSIKSMELGIRILGEDHPDTLRSMSILASTYWNQGR